MTKKRKASLGLSSLGQNNSNGQTEKTSESPVEDNNTTAKKVSTPEQSKPATKKKKQILPLYIEPALHEALHTLVFSERHKKTTFQTLFLEGLDHALKERGLPSVAELSSGKKTLNL